MLTIIGIYAILAFVGCENGKIEEMTSGVEQLNIEEQEKEEIVQNIPIPEVYRYNESGKIIIVMYHKFAKEEGTDEWCRSFDNFYKDLEYLYKKGYRSISLTDYINNDIKVPIGCTPIVLTFDDGSKGQFNLIKNDKGELIANPDSAVGVMEEFYVKHPDFGLNGTFFVNGSGFFSGEGTREERLQYLINKGFEIGNHTNSHVNFSKASIDEIQKEIGMVVKNISDLTNGYTVNTLALPFGITSKEYADFIKCGEYEGITYENKAILLVGASPALSPNSDNLNLLRLPRVRARGGNKEVDCDLYWWIEKMESNPELKYYRLDN